MFGDQQDYSVSEEKQSGPICCPSLAGVTSCNEVPYFSPPSLSPHLHLLLLFSISLLLPFLPVLVYIFFKSFFLKNHPSVLHFLHPASRACVIPPQAYGWRTCAESGCGFFSGSALKKQRRDPVGAGDLCRKLHFRLTCSLFL